MATTQDLLDDALAAYHDLQTGKSARTVVDQNGERVEYTAANSAKLYAYIQTLKAQIANASMADCKPYQPLQFTFK